MKPLVVEVGFKLEKPLEFYTDLMEKRGGMNVFSAVTHDIYWAKGSLDGLSENEMKTVCIRFRTTRGVREARVDSFFQNLKLYDISCDDTLFCSLSELSIYENKFKEAGFKRVFDTIKLDYHYVIGDMKSRIQLQYIDSVGLILYYDNPDYYGLSVSEQRRKLIDELNSCGFSFDYDMLGVDKLRTLYYGKEMLSLNQNA